jgi:hypothetical protein
MHEQDNSGEPATVKYGFIAVGIALRSSRCGRCAAYRHAREEREFHYDLLCRRLLVGSVIRFAIAPSSAHICAPKFENKNSENCVLKLLPPRTISSAQLRDLAFKQVMRRELAKCLTLAGWRSYTSARFDRRTFEHLAALSSGLSSCQNDSTAIRTSMPKNTNILAS